MRIFLLLTLMGLSLSQARTITIAPGQTLYQLSKETKVSQETILRINNLTSDQLKAGQVLTLPDSPINTADHPRDVQASREETGSQPPLITYTVKAKETLYSISRWAGITVEELQQANALQSTQLKIGQLLKIPRGKSEAPVLTPPSASRPSTSRLEGDQETKESGPEKPFPAKPEIPAPKEQLFRAIYHYLGVPYLWGGNDEKGIDCSGYTTQVMRQIGIHLPRTAAEQWKVGLSTPTPEAGDLVFFDTVGEGKVTHVAFYLGEGKMASANSYIGKVIIEDMYTNYWNPKYLGAKRYA